MPYVERIVQAGAVREHKKMYSSRVHSAGAKRSPNRNRTSKAAERVNARRAEEQLRWLLNANFTRGDYHLVLHYYDHETNLEQAERDRREFLRLCRKEYRKQKVPWKYIACTETKRMTNVHHHIVIKPLDPQKLQALWEDTLGARMGHISLVPLDRRGNHAKLAHYLMKETEATMRRFREAGRRGKRFSCSQGLTRPEPVYRIVNANTWSKTPRARKGYLLSKDDDGAVVRWGVHEITGWPWMEYFEIWAGPDPPEGETENHEYDL